MTKETESEHKHTKKQLSKNHILAISGVIILVILLLAVIISWLYTGKMSQTKEKIFSRLPLPVAFVQLQPISSVQYFKRTKLANELLKQAGQSNDDVNAQILDQLIETEKVELLAQKNGIKVSNDDIEASYKSVLAQIPTGNEDDLKKELKDKYGLDVSTFKNEVIRQTVTQEKLSLWHNQQESLNSEAYKKGRELISELDKGTSFEEVATKYNQDMASKDFAGDSGFVPFKDLLPEFQDGLKDLAIGDKKLVTSRYGLHILKVIAIEEKEIDGNVDKNYNLQQIFIRPNDFLKWFTDESKNIRAIKLL